MRALTILTTASLLALAAPAVASAGEVTGLIQERVYSEGYLPDIGVTRTRDEPVVESMVLACWSNDEAAFCGDVWNMESIEDDNVVRDRVHETDLEAEGTLKNVLPDVDARLKLAVYEVRGSPEIFSARFAIDRRFGACTGTLSVEHLSGGASGTIGKVNGACTHTSGNWTLRGEVGVAYNTGLTDQFAVPWQASAMYRYRNIAIGPYARGYFSERDNRASFGGQLQVFFR